jgi:adhesin/invasin
MTQRLLASLFLLGTLAACDGPTDPDPGPTPPVAARLRATAGDGQAGTVGQQLPVSLTVRVEDASGGAVAEQPVVFRVLSGGGTLANGAGVTLADGTASELWTLGASAGSQQVEARATVASTGAVLADTFTAVAGAGAGQAITVVGSAARTGSAGLPVDSLVIRVTDQFGNPVAGHPLVWTVVSGGGSIAGSAATDAGGVGKGAWMLGTVVDSAQQARVFAGVSLSADFTAIATLPAGTAVTVVAGNGQTGTAGQALADSLAVMVALPDGRPVVGVNVHWAPSPGSGSVSPAVARTGANGRAAGRWTLGTVAGTQLVTALVSGASSAAITATAVAGAPATMTAISGSGQTAPPGQTLPAPLVVELRDAFGNPVAGWAVQWTVDSGGGSVSPPSNPTNAAGRAQTQWTLGASGAGGSATASSAGVAPVTFTSPGSPVPATVSVFSGNGQSAPAGSPLPNPLAVRVADANGAPLQGVTVRWAAVSGGGRLGADSVTVTDIAGLARAGWGVGPELGTSQAVEARVAGVATPATFTATATPPPSVTVTKVAGDAQTQTVNMTVPVPPAVRVTLPDGRPLRGATVTWTAAFGSTATPPTSTTDVNGFAQTAWKMGPNPGTFYTLTAASLGSSATFSVTAVALLYVHSGNNQQSSPFTPVPDSLVARVARADGTPIAGVTIEWVSSAGGVASPTTSVSDAQGLVRTAYTLGSLGTQQVIARAPAYDNTQVVFTLRAVSPILLKVSGDGQSAPAGTTLPQPLVVRLIHADGRPLPGASIVFNPRKGTATPPNATTDADGYASTQWTIGTDSFQLTAYNQLYLLSVSFTASKTP